jgi:hypothetical protein
MTKQSGLGQRLFVGGYDLSGDIGAIDECGGGPELLDMTGIDKSAKERLGGVRDGHIDFTSFFNAATGQEHARFSLLSTSAQYATWLTSTTLGAPSANILGKQLNYDGKRGSDGALTMEIELPISEGTSLEWGEQGTAGIRTDTAATNGAAVDGGASSAFGLSAWLHVFAFTGTSVTVKLQESSDSGAGDAWADVVGGGFTAATGITSQRIATAAGLTVERYLRVVTTGTFSNAQFSVSIVRNEVSPT